MDVPQLYKKSRQQIYEDCLSLAEQYVPEWNTSGEQDDVGLILAKVYAEMFEGTLNRFNKILYKNYIYFLNILGADTLAASPAKGYASVKLNRGVTDGVFIKKGTRLYHQNHKNDRIIYETKDDFRAMDNTIEAIYCVDAGEEKISMPYEKEQEGKKIPLFQITEENNLQKFSIVLSDQEVLRVSEHSQIIVTVINEEKKHIENKVAAFLSGDCVKWECSTAEGWKEVQKVSVMANHILLQFGCPVEAITLEGEEVAAIRCTVLSKPADAEVSFTELRISSKGEEIVPDYMYSNDLEIPVDEILPFQREFSPYDSFYINSDMAFSKKGAIVRIDMDVSHMEIEMQNVQKEKKIRWKHMMRSSDIQEPEKVPMDVERVVWEYWNGNGWARLFEDNMYQDFFNSGDKRMSLVFRCPLDSERLIVGAHEGMWIRARILSVNNLFELNSYYRTPVLKDIKISYSYRKYAQNAKSILISKNLETIKMNLSEKAEVDLFQNVGAKLPAAYFALQNPMQRGPIKIFFLNALPGGGNNPALKWEYYGIRNGVPQWIEINLMDETDFLAKSGLLTFILSDPMQKHRLFSRECYWLRAVNTDQLYEQDSVKKPVLKGIYFNTVKIIQKETMQTEYFYIEPHQENKLIDLAGKNIAYCSVWVNEIQTMLADELYTMNIDDKAVKVERDEAGRITEYWVRWKEVKNFSRSSDKDRVYRLDPKEGKIRFGNGKKGCIPFAMDEPSIRVEYSVIVGEAGNCDGGEIEDFVDSIPFVDTVFNVEAISGGCDVEPFEDAIQRSSRKIKVLNRAVTAEDFSVIIKEADRNVVAVKLMQNQEPENKAGFVKAVILTKDIREGEFYFSEIKANILKTLMKKAPVTLAMANRIIVEPVTYVQVSARIKVFVESYNDYQEVYTAIENTLEQYLHPIHGNFDGNGFEIGEMPSRIKIRNVLKKLGKIRDFESIHLNYLAVIEGVQKEISEEYAQTSGICVPVNGKHEIYIEILP